MSNEQLIKYLMQGGTYGHFWNLQEKETAWWRTDNLPPLPTGPYDLYFGVHPSKVRKGSHERTTAEDIVAVNCIYADFDTKDFDSKGALASYLKSLKPRPSAIVDTGGGYHCYWFLDRPYPPTEADNVQRRWPSFIGSDPAAKDLARVLRIPGTLNHKYNPPRPIEIKYISFKTTYPLENLDRHSATVIATRAASSVEVVPEGRRNEDLAAYAGSLRRQGADEEDIFEACRARTNKWHEAPLSEPEVRKIARSIAGKEVTSFLLTEKPNHEGNAQCVARLFGKGYLHCPEAGWMHYTGTYWERDVKKLTRDVVRTLTRRRTAVAAAPPDMYKGVYTGAKETRPNVANTMSLLESILPVQWKDFDSDPDLLNCANGVLNLRTGEITPHEREQRFTYCLRTEYHPDADASSWVKFLGEVVDADVCEAAIEYLQLALGYSITGDTREEVMFYLVGPTRSGKGTFIETVKTMLGGLAWEVAFDTFSGKRRPGDQNFDLAPLKNCRFVAASEGARKTWLNSAFIKRISGGNTVNTAFKHQTPFEYRPIYKIWLSSNFEPQTDPGDDGAWGRLKVIRFPRSFYGKEDKRLKSRLVSKECLEGVLAWIVEGTQKWYALDCHGLATPPFVQEVVSRARSKLDSVALWAAEYLVAVNDEKAFVGNERYFASYKAWCGRRDFKARGLRTVTADLTRLGYSLSKSVDRVLSKRCRGVLGVKLVETPMNDLNFDLKVA